MVIDLSSTVATITDKVSFFNNIFPINLNKSRKFVNIPGFIIWLNCFSFIWHIDYVIYFHCFVILTVYHLCHIFQFTFMYGSQ